MESDARDTHRAPLWHVLRRVIVVVSALVAAVAIWNLAITRWRIAANPAPGQIFSVDGRQMYIHCVGDGSPAIVIESGLGNDTLDWYGVQRSLAPFTRVCAYDRSGLGLSEPRTGARDANAIARQLHDLLDQAGVTRPFIPIGWSAGGLYVREYARLFPADLAGLVLVESSIPRQLEDVPGDRTDYDELTRTSAERYRWQRLRVTLGWERLMGRCTDPLSKDLEALPPDEARRLAGLHDAHTCRPEFIGGVLGELLGFEASAAEAGRLTSLGDTPLLVITMDTGKATAAMQVWEREQERLKNLSSRSWRVVARGAGHAVQHDRPELVVEEVARLLDYVRAGPAPPFGMTATR